MKIQPIRSSRGYENKQKLFTGLLTRFVLYCILSLHYGIIAHIVNFSKPSIHNFHIEEHYSLNFAD